MNIENLIEEVRKFDFLYNIISKDYKNCVKKERIWTEIGARLNAESEVCKKKWKSLRDTYKKKKQALLMPSGSGAPDAMHKWKYFDCMSFLDNVECSRRTIGNVDVSNENFGDDTNDDTMIEMIDLADESISLPPTTSTPTVPQKHKTGDRLEERFSNFLQKAESAFQVEEEDSTCSLFRVLAKKVGAANLDEEQVMSIESEVSALVYAKLFQYKK